MPEPVESPRRRGGQPGNSNARSTGFYSRALTNARALDLFRAAREQESTDAIQDDIAMLRLQILQLVTSADGVDTKGLAALSRSLAAFYSVAQKLSPADASTLGVGVEAVLAEVRALAGVRAD